MDIYKSFGNLMSVYHEGSHVLDYLPSEISGYYVVYLKKGYYEGFFTVRIMTMNEIETFVENLKK